MSNVVALSSTVNSISEAAKDSAIRNGRRLSLVSPEIEPPIITGSNGRTHGASTVRMPAMNAPISRNICATSSRLVCGVHGICRT